MIRDLYDDGLRWVRETMIDSLLHDRQMAENALRNPQYFSSCPETAEWQYEELVSLIQEYDMQLMLLNIQ